MKKNIATTLRNNQKKAITIIVGLAIILLAAAIFHAWGLILPDSVPASTGSMYHRWSSRAASKGDEVNLSLRITPGAPIDTVMAVVEFNPDNLEYKNTSYDTSAFPTQIPAVVRDDSVMVQAAIVGGKTVEDDVHIATLTFVAKTDGTLSAKLTGNSARAGIALNPQIDRASLPATVSETPLWVRAAISALLALIVVSLPWLMYTLIKKRRGQVKK